MDEEIRKKLIKQGKLVDKWGKKITEAENSEIIAEETEYNESIRRNLIKQGKLVDEWGRKIQDKKQYTKNEKWNIFILIVFAFMLAYNSREQIIYVLNWIINNYKGL